MRRGSIEGRRDKEKQRMTYLMSLNKWMAEKRLGKITNDTIAV